MQMADQLASAGFGVVEAVLLRGNGLPDGKLLAQRLTGLDGRFLGVVLAR